MSELRKRIIAHIEAGKNVADVSEALGVARSTMYRTKKLYQEMGALTRVNGGKGRDRSAQRP